MKKLFILAATCFFSLCSAQAEVAPSHAAALEKMFAVMKMDQQYEASLVAGFESGLGMSGDQIKSLPQEQQDKFNAAIAKVKIKLMEMMGWAQMKGEMMEAYAKVFSEKEVNDITAMMDSPTGQMLVSKQVIMVSEAMKRTQSKMQGILPEIMKIVQDEMTK
ncbi:DUF2059 domain-containing protein [Prosthecobacter sp.]|uniref:DUF2059 domain-containing protein n=1 Tax=Prosthecobacter sp. TaxID=1965333 RepID=UPI00378506D3